MSDCGCSQPAEDVQKEKDLDVLIEQWSGVQGALIPLLQGAQAICGYLPKEVLLKIARAQKVPSSRVFGVATFYAQFHLIPRGRNIIRVCLGTACHVRGGAKIFERTKKELGVENEETTEDRRYTLETVACLGCCGLSPVIMANDDTYGSLIPEKLPEILQKYE
jgi:NADH-quinone oxidoreductase subunit E